MESSAVRRHSKCMRTAADHLQEEIGASIFPDRWRR